jgi:hypothetical protein
MGQGDGNPFKLPLSSACINAQDDAKDETVEKQGTRVETEGFGYRFAPLWAGILAMTPFLGILLGRVEFYFDDHFRFSTPIAGAFAEAIRGHHLPLWNPWVLSGTPLVAERGGMVSHPGMLLALIMEPSHAVGTLMVLLLGVLAAGSTALFRTLSVRPMLAIGAGAAIGLSGPALTYTSNAPFLATLAFLPLVLLGAIQFGEGKGSIMGSGLALGMALLGGDLPGALLFAVIALFIYRASGGRLRTGWLHLAGVGLVALVVGAGSWYPVVWVLPLSERGIGIAATEAGRWSFHLGEWLGFVWPHPMGLPLPQFTLWPFLWLGDTRLFLNSVWVGALVSVASIYSLSKAGPRFARTCSIIALVLLIAATGNSTPLWFVLRPIFTFIRYPSKLAGTAAVLIAFSGVLVLERLLANPRKMRNLCFSVMAIGIVGAVMGTRVQSILARMVGTPTEVVLAAASALFSDTTRIALLAAVGAGIFFLVERGRLSITHSVPLLAVVVFLDVFVTTADLSWTRIPATTPRPAFLPDVGPRGPRVMRLEEVTRARLSLNERAFTDEQLRQAALLTPLTNQFFRASVLEPYGLYLGDVALAMADLAKTNPLAMAEVSASNLVLAGPSSPAVWLASAVDERRLIPVASTAAGAMVLRVPQALPRSFLATCALLAPRAEIPQKLAHNHTCVLLTAESELRKGSLAALDRSAIPSSLQENPVSSPVAVDPTAWRPGAASYLVETATPALLVEMDAFVPGWHVFVDGQEQPILQANVFGHAVVIPAGRHVVEWQFYPRLVVASLLASWFSLGIFSLGLLLRRRLKAAEVRG